MKIDATSRSVGFHASERVADHEGHPGARDLPHSIPAVSAHFTREGEYWTISSDGRVFRLRDSRGLGFVARLLEQPGARFPASVLARGADARESNPRQTERDRVNVTKSIKATVRKIASHHPDLALHLEGTIKTGAFCAYLPIEAGVLPPRD